MDYLTPIEFYDGWYWKREDRFTLEGIANINGSKLRLFHDSLVSALSNKVIDTVAICKKPKSHTFYTMTHLCKCFNLKLINTDMLQENYDLDSQKNIFCIRHRYDNSSKYNYNSIAYQVNNIPSMVENIIVPCGSGHTLYGILTGLSTYHPVSFQHFRVFAIGNKPFNYLGISKDIATLVMDQGIELLYFNYKRDYQVLRFPSNPPFDLDTHFEFNVWRFAQRKLLPLLDAKTLFWVTANYNFLHQDEQ